MDIKSKRRDAAKTTNTLDGNPDNIQGMIPGLPNGVGTAASDNNVGWEVRSQSWQRGADTDYGAVQAENEEQAQRWGVPYQDNFPNPNGVPSNVGFCGVASRNTDDPLPNPHNWSSNPGYMGTSTASMMTASAPRSGGGATRYRTAGGGSTPGGTAAVMKNPVVGRSPVMRGGSISMPAPGDTDPKSEGGPLVMTQGNNT